MVVVNVKVVGSNKWVRESFLDPRHYCKWYTLMGKNIQAVRPVRGVCKRA